MEGYEVGSPEERSHLLSQIVDLLDSLESRLVAVLEEQRTMRFIVVEELRALRAAND